MSSLYLFALPYKANYPWNHNFELDPSSYPAKQTKSGNHLREVLNRLSRYPARQTSCSVCTAAAAAVWPPSLRQAYCVSVSFLVLVVAHASWPRTKYPRTFQVLSHFAFALLACGYRLAVRRDVGQEQEQECLEQKGRQTTTAVNPNTNPSSSSSSSSARSQPNPVSVLVPFLLPAPSRCRLSVPVLPDHVQAFVALVCLL